MEVENIVRRAKRLSDDDFENLMYQLLDDDRPGDLKKKIRVRAQSASVKTQKQEEWKKRKQSGGLGVSLQRDSREWPKPQTAGSSKEAPQSSKKPKEVSKPAFKSPIIFRGDLIPDNNYVFFDVEKLSLQLEQGSSKHEQVASSVAVVNQESNIILWAFIKWKKVCQTFTTITGITKEKLEIGLPIDVVQRFFLMACKGNTLVGWDMKNDLTALFVNEGIETLVLTQYFQDDKGKMKLKDVWTTLCNKGEETFQCGVHSAIQDARATRDVYRKMLELKTQYPESPNRCVVPIPRSERAKFKFDPTDVCKCKKSTLKRPKQSMFFLPE